jgi:predicted transcriptional regulator
MALKLGCRQPGGRTRISNDRIARQLGITRQAVDARLKAADYHLLDEMMLAFLEAYPQTEARR